MTEAAHRAYTQRMEIARRVTADLTREHPGAAVWLEGPLGAGIAHARSDIDLRLVADGTPPQVRSRLVDGVRVDLSASTLADIGQTRALLGSFHFQARDLSAYRKVRAHAAALTALATARTMTGDETLVLDGRERDVYRQWMLADRVERAVSLIEDLDGLLRVGMNEGADLVWRQLSMTVVQAENTARGHPLLGDKWAPALADPYRPLDAPRWGDDPALPAWFRQTRARLLAALEEQHPRAGADHDHADADTSPEWERFGWLPQRHSDSWTLQFADTRIALTGRQFTAWAARVRARPARGQT
ncbi:hypothetical protein [Streptomyces sp. NPDC101455]|uniref:hypothetical protein n=1 Tax=Streptomyces sp. NPDC101455 TaxID=3366142 RepID=UPI0037FC75ED